MKTIIDYPTPEEEIEIMKRFSSHEVAEVKKVLDQKSIDSLISLVDQIYVSDNIFQYVRDLIFTSRFPDQYGLPDIKNHIAFGASPRASLALIECAKVLAMIDGRGFVLPEDIKEIAYDVLRHRIIPSYEAIAENITTDEIIKIILDNTKIV